MLLRHRHFAILCFTTLLTVPAHGADLSVFLWKNRPVVVFSDTPEDPRFIRQMDMIADDEVQLTIRDVVVLTDTDPAAKSALREQLRPRGFMLVLIGKDGKVKLRKPSPWSVRELSRAIDKMPLRRDEIEQSRTVTE
ncbi:MAG: DUF4174 domain-containing protein [Rhodobacteraceae bacterium]|nr:DUF4174 domain-containing protein [Paracoccaceae bacterium]